MLSIVVWVQPEVVYTVVVQEMRGKAPAQHSDYPGSNPELKLEISLLILAPVMVRKARWTLLQRLGGRRDDNSPSTVKSWRLKLLIQSYLDHNRH